ncbi:MULTISPECIES: FkbM family methyltransferase [Paenibacillus]|uniref:FkbM family methyltransferase n=1 Tax=Paenibacillus TaxID=44249 RepID=UPI001C8EDA44|nr:FkbM family methyltransferase [Paenibacillus cucumis (ex Kampfer et al. 2016)]MDP9698979.1 FkbM family methyltransferase [Paenibacillus intestini]
MTKENKNKIRNFISRFYRHHNLSDSDNLVELGLMNSLFAAQLTMFLEQEFEIQMEIREQFFEKFNSIDTICSLIDEHIEDSTGSHVYQLPNGLKVEYLNKTDADHFYEDIFVKQSYLSNGIELRDGDCVFDIGANIGLFSLFALQRNKGITVYAFEPSPLTYKALQKNLNAYKDQVHLFECGISNKEGSGTFTHYIHSSGMSTFHPNEDQEMESLRNIITNATNVKEDKEHLVALSVNDRLQSEIFTCEIRTMASVLGEHPIKIIDLLKIDAQKSEWEILRGIPDEAWPKIRQVVMEIHDLNNRVSEIEKFLGDLNYQVHIEQDVLYKGTNHFNLYAIQNN